MILRKRHCRGCGAPRHVDISNGLCRACHPQPWSLMYGDRRGHPGDPAKLLALGRKICERDGVEPTSGHIALRLGVHRRTVLRWTNGSTRSVRECSLAAIERHTGVWLGDGVRLVLQESFE